MFGIFALSAGIIVAVITAASFRRISGFGNRRASEPDNRRTSKVGPDRKTSSIDAEDRRTSSFGNHRNSTFGSGSTIGTITGRTSNSFRRISESAKRLSTGFIGLISKAYGDKSPEPDYTAADYFSNPLKEHISEGVSAMRNPQSEVGLIDAIRSLGHISMTGGNETSGYIGKFIIPDLAAKLRNPLEKYEIKLACVEAISEMCAYCMKDNQDLAKEYGVLLFLLENLEHHDNSRDLLMRQWCAHSLYYCIVDNCENKRYVLNYNIWLHLKDLANYMSPEDTMWEFNDADMLLEMLRR